MMTSRKSAQCNLFQIDEIPEWSDCFYEWKYCGRCFCECYKIHQSKTVFNRFTTNRQIPCTFWHPFVCRFMRTHSHWVPPSNASNQVRIKYPLNAKKLHVHVHCSLFSKALKKNFAPAFDIPFGIANMNLYIESVTTIIVVWSRIESHWWNKATKLSRLSFTKYGHICAVIWQHESIYRVFVHTSIHMHNELSGLRWPFNRKPNWFRENMWVICGLCLFWVLYDFY